MSNRRQPYFLHFDRTWNARTPHMVAASSRKPAIKKHNHWSGPCERGRARQCMMKCSGFCETAWIRLRNERQNVNLKRAVQNPTFFYPEGCTTNNINNNNNDISNNFIILRALRGTFADGKAAVGRERRRRTSPRSKRCSLFALMSFFVFFDVLLCVMYLKSVYAVYCHGAKGVARYTII